MPSRLQRSLGLAAAAFGILTVFAGFSVIFGGDTTAALAGDVVTPVLWFNAVSGLVYIAAGVCIFRDLPCAGRLANGLTIALGIIGVNLAWHIASGGAFEPRTVGAMVFRFAFWAAIAVYWHRTHRTD